MNVYLTDFLKKQNDQIPLTLFQKNIYYKAVLIFIELQSTDKNIHHINKKELSEKYKISTTDLSLCLKQLKENNLIKIKEYTAKEIKDKLQNKNLNSFGIGKNICSWCKIKTIILHSHHYPISKEEGGRKTVDICPNCHFEFHHFKMNSIYINENNENNIFYNRLFAEKTSIEEAIFIQKILNLWIKNKEKEFIIIPKIFCFNSGITIYTFRKIVKKFEQLNLIKTNCFSLPLKKYYWINEDEFTKYILNLLKDIK